MARTVEGTRLTEAHRAAQLALRAGSVRQLIQLWRVVDPTNLSGTIDTFAQAAALLGGTGFDQSGGISARYYRLFRSAEGVPGPGPSIILAKRPGVDVMAGELRGAALSGIVNARKAGFAVGAAKSQGLVRVVGALTKLVLTGGRSTVINTVQRDPQALGWARTTSGDPCAFCRMLAGRGPVYKSDKVADFKPHDSCACGTEVVYRGDGPTEQSQEYAKEWKAAQAWARENGISSEGTSNPALNIYRQYLSGGATASVSPVTEESGQ
jgi:hypothetical protein